MSTTRSSLKEPAGKRVGWLGSRIFNEQWLNEKYWTVAGYPSNYTGNAFRSDQQVAHIGCAVREVGSWTPGGPLFHDCDTGQGASGSPIFAYWKGKPYVIAVNYAGWGPRNRNRMESCSPPKVGECMNIAASARSWQSLLTDLLLKTAD